jgi:hypothetical protein
MNLKDDLFTVDENIFVHHLLITAIPIGLLNSPSSGPRDPQFRTNVPSGSNT